MALLLLATFLIRAVDASQPIVENYVGRQVPTAMVARNLDRGSGFLWPQLDTAPFPNYFLVEPPIYESVVVVLKRATGLRLEEAGRIASALASTLAALGLFLLARRREGAVVALLAVAVFAVVPLTIRYGRAFQPDAAMMGVVVLGLACWDRLPSSPRWYWLGAAWLLVTLGFAIKITAAFLLLPLLLVITHARTIHGVLAVCSTLLPALCWYAWANHVVAGGEGSLASADNRSIWLGLLGPGSLLKWETLRFVGWFLLVRAFTPLGAGLAIVGLAAGTSAGGQRDALWPVWAISALAAMACLAEKLHHEYYWLLLAPVVAVGIARGLALVAASHRAGAVALAAALLVLCGVQVRSTWRIPEEWAGLVPGAAAVTLAVPAEAWVVGPEALLFHADRRGCRMEWSDDSVARAAGEWQPGHDVHSPLDLVEFYRGRGARYFADLGDCDGNPRRKGLHDEVRRRYKVIVDRPDCLVAELADYEVSWNAK